ncbi:MAG TPA: NADH-quinone oxidoreductase subunit J [Tepidisphaeraceae bacterium]|jgi:NADH-quinone oxidoreductase subunit J|nr:NADH-quinone oxidoreductase subunit J [Tepidisphaeraceae bacterium]
MIARLFNAADPFAFLAQAVAPAANVVGPVAETPSPIAPIIVLVLCAVAGIGTVLLLPGKREASIRKIGGVVLALAALVFAGLLARAAGGMGAYFWIFSAIAIVGAVRVVTHPRPVYSALYFVMTVLASAGLFVLLWAEFMAAALILIYAGAILITYVFVIMLAASTTSDRAAAAVSEYDNVSREPIFASAVGFALMAVLLFVIFDKSVPITPRGDVSTPAAYRVQGNTQRLGAYLYQDQVVNLEMAGLLLTLAMVGAIVIARRKVWTGPANAGQAPGAAPNIHDRKIFVDDNPHSIPVYGTDNPRQKAYPET